MTVARWSVSLVAAIGVLAATLAAATIWLLITDPVQGADAVATAMSTREVLPFLQVIGGVLYGALRELFGYL